MENISQIRVLHVIIIAIAAVLVVKFRVCSGSSEYSGGNDIFLSLATERKYGDTGTYRYV